MKKYNTVLEYLVALEQLYKEMASANGHTHENYELLNSITNEMVDKWNKGKEVDLSEYVKLKDLVNYATREFVINSIDYFRQETNSNSTTLQQNIEGQINELRNLIINPSSAILVEVSSSTGRLYLNSDKYAYWVNPQEGTEIYLPSDSSNYQENHLYLNPSTTISNVNFPFCSKWTNKVDTFEAGKIYEIIFTRINNIVVGGVVVYE